MNSIELPRRKFLTGLASLIAAPAIVRVSSLMPVSAPELVKPTIIADLTGFSIGNIITFGGLNTLKGNPKQFVVTGVENGLTFYPVLI